MPRSVIIGGAGFIASHLADELIRNGHEVVLFFRRNQSLRNITHLSKNATFAHGDFTTGEGIKDALKGADFVFHLAISSLPGKSLNPSRDATENILGSIGIMDYCVLEGIKKLIFISSGGAVYGATEEIQISEDHPTIPISSYGACKLAVEKFLEVYRHTFGLDYSVLRVSNPYGERHNPLRGHGLIGVLLHRIKTNQNIEIWGNGEAVRDYIYVKDVAKALRLASEINSEQNIFNIGSSRGYSINDIIKIIHEVTSAEISVDYVGPRDFDVPSNILNSKKAKIFLGWQAETELRDGIDITWKWMNGLSEDFFIRET